jgi:hypothetical protein
MGIRYLYIQHDDKDRIERIQNMNIICQGEILTVRNGPSETVYWLGGPSVSDVLQWDWIFVEARSMKQ